MHSQGVFPSLQAGEGLGDSGSYFFCHRLSKQIKAAVCGTPHQMPSRVVLGQNVDGGVLQGVIPPYPGDQGYF